MTDDDIKRLHALASSARTAEADYAAAQAGPSRVAERRAEYADSAARREFHAAASPDVLLALLDSIDALRRERDEARTERNVEADCRANAVRKRDAAMALLRAWRENFAGTYAQLKRLDALLGDGMGHDGPGGEMRAENGRVEP